LSPSYGRNARWLAWSPDGRQILAHIAANEWTFALLIGLAKAYASGDATGGDSSGFETDAYNQRQVDKRVEASIPKLIAEFERNRAATVTAVTDLDEGLLARPITSAGWSSGPIGRYTSLQQLVEHFIKNGVERVSDIVGSGA